MTCENCNGNGDTCKVCGFGECDCETCDDRVECQECAGSGEVDDEEDEATA